MFVKDNLRSQGQGQGDQSLKVLDPRKMNTEFRHCIFYRPHYTGKAEISGQMYTSRQT